MNDLTESLQSFECSVQQYALGCTIDPEALAISIETLSSSLQRSLSSSFSHYSSLLMDIKENDQQGLPVTAISNNVVRHEVASLISLSKRFLSCNEYYKQSKTIYVTLTPPTSISDLPSYCQQFQTFSLSEIADQQIDYHVATHDSVLDIDKSIQDVQNAMQILNTLVLEQEIKVTHVRDLSVLMQQDARGATSHIKRNFKERPGIIKRVVRKCRQCICFVIFCICLLLLGWLLGKALKYGKYVLI
ncbi:hypothetical protein RCL1_008632 [Eukaryota sp. TZLM3-RCL]